MNIIGIVHRVHERFVKQLTGSRDAGTNCTMGASASAAFRQTNGAKRVTAQQLRDLTGDHVGGTNLDQAKLALARVKVVGLYGPFRGMLMAAFYANLRQRGAIVQGSSAATKGTRWQASTTFSGNHCWYVGRGLEWFKTSTGRWLPRYLWVLDPLADGRRAGIAKSPLKIPRATFEKFCAGLSLGSYRLGPGKVYVLFTKITNPHRHNRYGGVMITARNLRLKPGYNIRTKPSTAAATSIRKSRTGDYLAAAQKKTDGPSLGGSRVWYGDHSGRRWVHASALA